MTKFVTIALAIALLVAPALGQESDSLSKLQADYQKAGQEDDRIDNEELHAFSKRAVALAEKKKGRVGFQAVQWVFHITRTGEGEQADREPYRKKAMTAALATYAQSSTMVGLVQEYLTPYYPDELSEFDGYLAALEKKTTKQEVKAASILRRASNLSLKNENLEPLSAEEKATALALYKRVTDEFAEVAIPGDKGNRKFADIAKKEAAALAGTKKVVRHDVRVGGKAPEIEAEDVDGVNFKLSDYRGKVVMLDFWGDW